jgi:DNA-binding NtrC family response regulator
MIQARILIAEDEEITRDNLVHALQKDGHSPVAVADGAQAVTALENEEFDLVLTDLRMDKIDGMGVLEATKALRPDAEVIILTGYATVETAVEAMDRGAYNYLSKPYQLKELRALIAKALEKHHLRLQLADLKRRMEEGSLPLIIGQSQKMQLLRKAIAQVATVESNVLILGETGTGKELVARSIHALSCRKNSRFVAVNCAAFSEELLVNELFGHEREAYTGAHSQKKGLLEIADSGTFFLDEIGDMPLSMQAKLLRVLEERTFMRIGGTLEVPVDVRIIAATNKDLKLEVEEGAFRRDLYYRLNVINFNLPSLIERKEDIPLLANHFVRKYASAMNKPIEGISVEATKLLLDYAFPGNVRELENIIESAVVMCTGKQLEIGNFPPDLQKMRVQPLSQMCPKFTALKTLKELEQEYIAWVLEQTGNNKTRAAEILGIDRASLWRKLQRQD